MNKKHKFHHPGKISKFFHCVGGGSCIVLLLGYFLLDKIINTGTRFFLCWTCVSVLTIIVGLYFRIISGLDGIGSTFYVMVTPLTLVVIIVQSLVITYLFVTHQPSPDQMSRIYTLSWILVLAVIHTAWASSEISGNKSTHPLYGPISNFFGTDVSEFSFLVFALSTFGTIALWITIALLLVGKGNGNIMDANTKFFFQWTGMSILTLITSLGLIGLVSIVNHIRKRTFKPTDTVKGILVCAIYPLSTPFFAIFIIQGLAMTYLFANMRHPDPDQMSQIHILSWILFATATSMFCITTCKPLSEDLDADNRPCNFPRLIAIISTLSTIGLWIAIAVLMAKQ